MTSWQISLSIGYVAIGVVLYFLGVLRKKLTFHIAGLLIFLIIWPIFMMEPLLQKLIVSVLERYSSLLEKSLNRELVKENPKKSDVEKKLQFLTSLNYFFDHGVTRNLEFRVQKFRQTNLVLKTHLNKDLVGMHLFGEDYFFNGKEYQNDTVDRKGESLFTATMESESVPEQQTEFINAPMAVWRLGDPLGEPWLSIFTREFRKSIEKLDKKIKGRIVEAIMEICASPIELRGDTQKPLVGELDGHWRYRIGDYRLVYLPMIEHHKIVFTRFDSRGQIYS